MPHPDRLVVFAHGKESGPWGTKITRLAEVARQRGYAVESPDYSFTTNPQARVAHLSSLPLHARKTLVLAGSSMGGYVAAMGCTHLRPQALFLMAPALYFPGWDDEAHNVPPLGCVVHGRHDDIVPPERGLRFAATHRLPLHLLESDHGLNDQLPQLCQLFDALLANAAALTP